MRSDVKQWFVSTKNIHATINIEKRVLLKICKELCILPYSYNAKLLYNVFFVFKQTITYFGKIIMIMNKVNSGNSGHLFCG
jgi:hypothetical protein